MWHGFGFGWWPIFGLFWCLFVIFIVVSIVQWLLWGRRWGPVGHGCYGPWGHHADAEGILRQRLARGEIDDGEYQRLLTILRS